MVSNCRTSSLFRKSMDPPLWYSRRSAKHTPQSVPCRTVRGSAFLNRSALFENAILAAISGPAGSMNLIIPLYLSYLGHPVPVIGLMLALGSVSTLLSRIPAAAIYRPERGRLLLIGTLAGGAATFAVLP